MLSDNFKMRQNFKKNILCFEIWNENQATRSQNSVLSILAMEGLIMRVLLLTNMTLWTFCNKHDTVDVLLQTLCWRFGRWRASRIDRVIASFIHATNNRFDYINHNQKTGSRLWFGNNEVGHKSVSKSPFLIHTHDRCQFFPYKSWQQIFPFPILLKMNLSS